jgi:hypothetical protein
MSAPVIMYSTRWCPYCIAARGLLESLGVRFQDIDVGGQPQLRAEMERRSGRTRCRRSGSAVIMSRVRRHERAASQGIAAAVARRDVARRASRQWIEHHNEDPFG